MIGPKPTAAVDATGMESRHTSRYFFKRAGRKQNGRLWTKLTVACETASHFFTAARASLGPANDAPQFRPVMAQASVAVTYDRLLGDAAFDSEESHRYCREELGIRSTVIPLNRRNGGRKRPQTRYRRQMVRRFRKKPRGSRSKRVYGQRCGRRKARSRGISVCSVRLCGASLTLRANANVTCVFSPITSCSSPQLDRGFQQSKVFSKMFGCSDFNSGQQRAVFHQLRQPACPPARQAPILVNQKS